MPSTRTISVYTIDELTGKAREHAIEEERQALHENFDVDMLRDVFAERLAEKGYPTKDIRWSLSYSQGDGLAFYGEVDPEEYLAKNNNADLDKRKVARLQKLIREGDLGISITKLGGANFYDHWNTMNVEFDVRGELKPESVKALEDFETFIKLDVKDVSRELEKIGYQEIEYQTSEDLALENLRSMEVEFLASGKRA